MVNREEERNEKLRAIGCFLLLFLIIMLDFSLNHVLIDTHGVSMEPTLTEEDISLCKKTYGMIGEGDIIAYRNPDDKSMLITHRIHELNDSKIVTKGDNNERVDKFDLNLSDIYCKVTVKNVNITGYL